MIRLGRRPHDPAALAGAPSLVRHPLAAMLPSPVIDRSGVPFQPRMFGNDSLPDCTAAGTANLALGISALNGFQTIILDDRAPAFYADCIGQHGASLATLAATDGAVMLDVMRRIAAQGFSTGAQLLVGRFGTLAVDRMRIATAVDRLGGAALGVRLYARDMDTAESAAPWDALGDPGAEEGGHDLNAWDFPGLLLSGAKTDQGLADDALVRLPTWGGFKLATWRWIEARCDEAYGLVFDQLGQTDGTSLGLDLAALDAALAGMTA